MYSLEIIVICSVIAYIVMKLRDYIKSAQELKRILATTHKIQSTKQTYKDHIKHVEAQIYILQEKLFDLGREPVSHATKRQIKMLKRQIRKLTKSSQEFQAALKDFETISAGKVSETERTKILKSYLNDKGRL